MDCLGLPQPLCDYVKKHTKRSRTRQQLMDLLLKLMSGETVRYKDIKRVGVRYHVDRMRRLGLLDLAYANGVGYVVLSPYLIAKCLEDLFSDIVPSHESTSKLKRVAVSVG